MEESVLVNLDSHLLQALDTWIHNQAVRPSRSEAVYSLVRIALKPKLTRNSSTSKNSKIKLCQAVQALRAKTPISNRFLERNSDHYRDCWITWLRNTKSRNAREVYQRVQRCEWIVWLNEAAGAPPKLIRQTIKEMRAEALPTQTSAAIARKFLPWEEAAKLLFGNR